MRWGNILRERSEIVVGWLVFVVTLAIFWFSPVHQITDSNYSMLLSESLLHHRSFMLDGYNIPRLAPEYHDHTWKNGNIHQIELVGGHLYHYRPPGSSILSLPYVALLNAFGVSAANPDGTYNPRGERQIETSLAALLMSLLAVIFLFTGRLLLPLKWSVIVALGGALGTQIWSTASRALWADTWGVLLLGVVVYLMLANEVNKRRLNPILLASLLAWTYFVRPSNAPLILAITVYLWLFHRRLFPRYALTGALWFAGFVLYSWLHFHAVLPTFFRASQLSFDHFWTAFAGNLISPSRGLLIYVPVLFFVAYLLWRYWKHVAPRRLVWLSIGAIVLFMIAIAGFNPWWAGASYGPRYSMPLVPFFMLLAILGIQGMLAHRAGRTVEAKSHGPLQLIFGALLLATSVVINAVGAISHQAWMWNTTGDIDSADVSMVWNWKYPQVLAPVLKPPLPGKFPVAEGRIEITSRDSQKFLGHGWSNPEREIRWTDGKEAVVLFDLREIADTVFQIRCTPFIVPVKHPKQDLIINLNGKQIKTLQITDSAPVVHEMVLPAGLLTHRNILKLELPDAAAPKFLGLSDDQRQLGVAVYWIGLQPQNGRQP